MRRPRLFLRTAAAALLALPLLFAACDTAEPPLDPVGPEPIEPISSDQQALVAAAFAEVEELFALGFDGSARSTAGRPTTAHTTLDGALAAMRSLVDTTTYTGVYDLTNSKGYLVTLQYREPQGVGVWTARVQHARPVTYDGAALDAVETVTLTFLTSPEVDAFLGDLGAGSNAYLVGTSSDPEAAFTGFDTWRVAQVFSPGQGLAVVGYTNAQLRESVTVREPVATLNANGTGTVRDGGTAGAIRTRYFGADFAVDAEGNVTGTVLRTLLSSGDTSNGSVVSRSDYPDGTFRQTRQRGGDGVVVRENTQG